MRERVNLIDNNLVCIEYDNENRLLPKVYIDDSIFWELCYPWYDSLIIKLVSKNIDDRAKVINGGPWMLFYHYLAVHNWSPEFIPSTTKINTAMVDVYTLDVEQGCFACICVEIDLDQPIVGRLWIKYNCYKVKYKGLHLICNSCGCYEHLGRDCKVLSSHSVLAEGMVVDAPKATVARGHMNNGNGSTIQAVSQGAWALIRDFNEIRYGYSFYKWKNDLSNAYVEHLLVAISFYKSLFCSNDSIELNALEDVVVPRLLSERVAEPAKPITKKEVGIALRSMGSYKAPGTMDSLVDYVHISDSNSKVNDL
ncbi:hypothetical protein POTOM_037365 [Populus tomentosa]|uniref:DUF4283 domain-containing protein n=1 Tax=Populus tomentosa TaxID=118781 RepID=A0A8X7YTQ2_POPTO|nr:hypothetical protein POTOM_037365 [Populus tomentosa]